MKKSILQSHIQCPLLWRSSDVWHGHTATGEGHVSTFTVWVQHWTKPVFLVLFFPCLSGRKPRNISLHAKRDGSKYKCCGQEDAFLTNATGAASSPPPFKGTGQLWLTCPGRGSIWPQSTGQVGLALTSPAKRCKSNSPYLAGFTLQDSDVIKHVTTASF